MQVLGIDRVMLATRDIDTTADRFSDLLETRFIDLGDIANAPGDQSLALSDVGIEFISPGHPEDEITHFLEENGPGVFAVAIRVSDLEAAVSHLSEYDIEPIERETRETFKEAFYHPSDFNGMLTIFTEYEAPHPTVVAADPEADYGS